MKQKKPLVFLILLTSVLSLCQAQRTLRYAIDSEGNLIVGEYSIPRNKDGDPDERHPSVPNLNIPSSVEGRKVTGIARKTFYGDHTLRTVNIPASITYIGEDAFSDCSNIERFTVAADNPRYKVEGNFLLDKINNKLVSIFKADEEIVIPDGITEIPEGFFSFTSSIEKITLPDSLVKICDKAFYHQYNLASINFPKNLHYIGDNAFEKCQKLSMNVILPETLTYLGKEAFKSTKITALTLPSNFESIPDGCFCSCNNLALVNFSKNLKYIGKEAFSGCSAFKDLKIPDTVESLGIDAFSHTKFTELVIPKAMTVVSDSAFQFSTIEEIIFHPGVKRIGKSAFYKAKIPSLVIPKSVESVGNGAFTECGIRSLVIEKGVKTIEASAFSWNDLAELKLPDTVTTIGENAFHHCRIQKLVLPKKISKISSYAFDENFLTTLELPKSVTYIGEAAFRGNWLEKLTLPAKLEHIGDMAFMTDDHFGRENLRSVKIPASVKFIGSNPFCHNTVVYAKKKSAAEKWCQEPGNKKYILGWDYY